MLGSPEEVSLLIGIIARGEAALLGFPISDDAVASISNVPQPYSSRATIEIDIAKLDETVAGIVQRASQRIALTFPPSQPQIGFSEVTQAIREKECHYLWFC
jgi:hypothetical protein